MLEQFAGLYISELDRNGVILIAVDDSFGYFDIGIVLSGTPEPFLCIDTDELDIVRDAVIAVAREVESVAKTKIVIKRGMGR